MNCLPAYVLAQKPLILAAYDQDFLKRADAFTAVLARRGPGTLLLQLGWQHEAAPLAAAFADGVRAAQRRLPELRIIVLTNTPKEAQGLGELGLETRYCHQNAFLDARRYPLLRRPEKKFDAIYIARITPFKRHALAQALPSLHLIGDYSPRERDFAEKTLAALPRAVWTRRQSSRSIHRAIAAARCGLCLSAEEGAMFVSAEYLLCGLPVVNTKNVGGRDLLMPEFAVRNVPDDPDAVAAAVAAWCAEAPAPEAVRAAFLELAKPHREALAELLAELSGGKPVPIPHKLGLRCRLWPWDKFLHGLRG